MISTINRHSIVVQKISKYDLSLSNYIAQIYSSKKSIIAAEKIASSFCHNAGKALYLFATEFKVLKISYSHILIQAYTFCLTELNKIQRIEAEKNNFTYS
jgi:hypothetical protein